MKLSGVVIQGEGYGRRLGFPTANIDRDEYQEKNPDLMYGVYAGWVTGERFPEPMRAGLVVGPEDAWGLPKLEAYILDFDGNLYGEQLSFHFCEFLRPYQEYGDEDDLRADIARDIEKIKVCDLCLPE